jgi:hypothetical protein
LICRDDVLKNGDLRSLCILRFAAFPNFLFAPFSARRSDIFFIIFSSELKVKKNYVNNLTVRAHLKLYREGLRAFSSIRRPKNKKSKKKVDIRDLL